MAAVAGGTVAGSIALTRLVRPDRRLAVMRPLALVGAALLVAAPAVSGLTASLVLFTLVGAFSACVLPARAAVMTALPDEMRGRVFGIASTGLEAAQLVAVLGAGAAAQVLPTSTVIAASGGLGVLAVTVLILTASGPSPRAQNSRRARRPLKARPVLSS